MSMAASSKPAEPDPFAQMDQEDEADGFGEFGDFEAVPTQEKQATEEPDAFGDFGEFEEYAGDNQAAALTAPAVQQ